MQGLIDAQISSQEIMSHLDLIVDDDLAIDTEFVKQEPKKITPRNFVGGLFLTLLGNNRTQQDLAVNIGLLSDCTVSQPAINYRLNEHCVEFLKCTLKNALVGCSTSDVSLWASDHPLFAHFNRILVQDSTVISLAPHLVEAFPGPSNKYGQSAGAKLQIVYDLLSEQYCYFELTPFTKNDQGASADILKIARPGDLVMRDMGYFSLRVFMEMLARNIYFLSRFRYGVSLFESDGETPIDLPDALKEQGSLDEYVYAGAGSDKVPGRLIAEPVAPEVAEKRRQEAKKDRDRRANHSDEYMQLLGWNIFFTNIPRRIWAPGQAVEANGFRWRIENVNRILKSDGFQIDDVPKGDETCIEVYFYAYLILITLFQNQLWQFLIKLDLEQGETDVSLAKVAKFIKQRPWIFMTIKDDEKIMIAVLRQILYHCRYDKRIRKSYPQKFRGAG